jgi:hypothetical protein
MDEKAVASGLKFPALVRQIERPVGIDPYILPVRAGPEYLAPGTAERLVVLYARELAAGEAHRPVPAEHKPQGQAALAGLKQPQNRRFNSMAFYFA